MYLERLQHSQLPLMMGLSGHRMQVYKARHAKLLQEITVWCITAVEALCKMPKSTVLLTAMPENRLAFT
jgi:hypothetical protein